ncbi:MAG: response regulator, partial [Nitrososphaeraceae archaeon]
MTKVKKILVVDDEPDITLTLKTGLENLKQDNKNLFEVETFNDPELAFSNYTPGKYDLLLLDFKMSKINGFELWDKIRKVDSKAKVCFITALNIDYESLRETFPLLEIECFIQKPIEICELVDK